MSGVVVGLRLELPSCTLILKPIQCLNSVNILNELFPERKAKEAEAAMREIARAAREAHRLSAHVECEPPEQPQSK